MQKPKSKKRGKYLPQVPRALDAKVPNRESFLEGLIQEAIPKGNDREAGIEFVETLLSMYFKRATILYACKRAFNYKKDRVDEYIRAAKLRSIDFVRKVKKEEHLAQSFGTMKEGIKVAFAKGDVAAAISAQRHLDLLAGLTKQEEGGTGMPLGVVLVPIKETTEAEWSAKQKAKG